jgi:CheY-like chemotaxis protein
VFGRQQVMDPEVLELDEVVSSAGRMLKRILPESVRLELALRSDHGLVRVDRSQLEQVILNLAVNARDAMPDGGRLTIETERLVLTREFSERHPGVLPGRYVLLAMTDTGVGMDESVQAQIFEPFFTTKSQGKGTGLGLSTVYGIVRQSGGHVWVYSEPARGTTFKVYFPEAFGEEQGGDTRPHAEAIPRGQGTILFAEDDAALRRIGERLLRQLGYHVLVAEHGEDGLRVAAEHRGPIDLLVTDVVMPGMSGMQLFERLRDTHPDLPVLFLSGWASDAVVRHRILEGEVPFLQKPFSAEELGRKVHELLRRS